jgi:hypothetical protein
MIDRAVAPVRMAQCVEFVTTVLVAPVAVTRGLRYIRDFSAKEKANHCYLVSNLQLILPNVANRTST